MFLKTTRVTATDCVFNEQPSELQTLSWLRLGRSLQRHNPSRLTNETSEKQQL